MTSSNQGERGNGTLNTGERHGSNVTIYLFDTVSDAHYYYETSCLITAVESRPNGAALSSDSSSAARIISQGIQGTHPSFGYLDALRPAGAANNASRVANGVSMLDDAEKLSGCSISHGTSTAAVAAGLGFGVSGDATIVPGNKYVIAHPRRLTESRH
jgi:hypothetical protein